ncbi:MAG TPA: hypothetical protein VHS09_02780 [Polyangiaceae bacterium]|jgi:hypothetical protein|nr:hypothetical protein [Polyangiaceae bacterium]
MTAASADDTTLLLAVGIPVGVLLFVGVLLIFIFSMVRRSFARTRALVEQEGIVLDTGTQWITIRYRGFRARGLRVGAGINKARCSLVLTRQGRIILMPGFQGRYWLVPANVTVGIAGDGALHIHSDNPSGEGAAGSISYRVAMPEAATWVNALTQAGARLQTGPGAEPGGILTTG